MHEQQEITMGTLGRVWGEGRAKSITFSVTQDCNLRCTYCYMTHKNNKHVMSFEVAKTAVDYILTDRKNFDSPAVIWEFIGGEPLIEIDLIDKISEYIKLKMFELDHPWKNNYMFFMCSNGLLYSSPKVQDYIQRNRAHVSIGISVDGNKQKHDLSRVKIDGSGSYDDVIKNVPLWLEQFPGSSTKSTFAHDDLPYLKDSIISLWEHGINIVAANVVFEDVWDENDPQIFETQLKELADYVIDHDLYGKVSVRFFSPSIGFAAQKAMMDMPFCGTGKMLAIDDRGNFYPCVRFLDFCQDNHNPRTIGNIYDGLDLDRLRPFYGLTVTRQSTEQCITCEVASGCANCTGNDYECSSCGTIFNRATTICEMHKANVRATKYFWRRYTDKYKKMSERDKHLMNVLLTDKEWVNRAGKFLYFITGDAISPHCHFISKGEKLMSDKVFQEGIKFCYENDYVPVFLGRNNSLVNDYISCHAGYVFDKPDDSQKNTVDIYDSVANVPEYKNAAPVAVLNIRSSDVSSLFDNVEKLGQRYRRINLNILDKFDMSQDEVQIYEEQLKMLSDYIIKKFSNSKTFFEINILTDIFYNTELVDCKAGKQCLTLAPDGKIYPCAAFYYSGEDALGEATDTFSEIMQRAYPNKLPLCTDCDATHCEVCRFINLKKTGEFGYSPKVQCEISHIERNVSLQLKEKLVELGWARAQHVFDSIEYKDPQERWDKKRQWAK